MKLSINPTVVGVVFTGINSCANAALVDSSISGSLFRSSTAARSGTTPTSAQWNTEESDTSDKTANGSISWPWNHDKNKKKTDNGNGNKDDGGTTGVELHMSHVKADITSRDLDVENECLLKAIASVYGYEYEIEWSYIQDYIDIREKQDQDMTPTANNAVRDEHEGDDDESIDSITSSGYWSGEEWIISFFSCTLCPNDDDSLYELPMMAMQSSPSHGLLENQFCTELQGSGVDVYSEVKDCTINFFYSFDNVEGEDDMDGDDDDMFRDDANKTVAAGASHLRGHVGGSKGTSQTNMNDQPLVQVVGHQGAVIKLHSVSSTSDHTIDVSILSDAFSTAYNAIHRSSGFRVSRLNLVREVDIPNGTPHRSGKKGNNKVSMISQVIWTEVDWECDGCDSGADERLPGVVSKTAPTITTIDMSEHKAFEGYFCHNLRMSSVTDYDHVEDCTIKFIDNPIQSA